MEAIHPPSDLPISVSGAESAWYFFVSMNLSSHAVVRKNLSASNFTLACRKGGSFSCRGLYAAKKMCSRTSQNRRSIFVPRVYRETLGKFVRMLCQD
jgi:hypothetical protein